ncbi:hypothetical protein C9I56_17970 [Paraburkholderia caribensis]|nr:hypothetical protein C9I56_17970 [Paraburkholderia caribensis]
MPLFQRAWLRDSRNVCGDKACLIRSYRVRIHERKRIRSQCAARRSLAQCILPNLRASFRR